jgi:hypothetical protein
LRQVLDRRPETLFVAPSTGRTKFAAIFACSGIGVVVDLVTRCHLVTRLPSSDQSIAEPGSTSIVCSPLLQIVTKPASASVRRVLLLAVERWSASARISPNG